MARRVSVKAGPDLGSVRRAFVLRKCVSECSSLELRLPSTGTFTRRIHTRSATSYRSCYTWNTSRPPHQAFVVCVNENGKWSDSTSARHKTGKINDEYSFINGVGC
ncbi:hypothetical protein DPEC_G00306490 [Dallia pectoralis]|uniref:Uncharacterized protein n=1 Tax=Dallia pectoralis TaxID=75939 RepID=A0ACC2FEA5_DALPE|nr:hypothetical protein DPEC_G00306490 [Dallia pectoralis]